MVVLTVAGALDMATARLKGAGIPSPRQEGRLLLADALSVSPEKLVLEPGLSLQEAEYARFEAALEKREKRMPMAQVLGRREFWSRSFKVTADTLDPRPDSETLISSVLSAFPDQDAPLRLLDLGTGTGCLLLTLLSEYPQASGLGIDLSDAACRVAVENATSLGLASRVIFAVGDWGRGLDGTYDVIVSNPPYIPEAEIETLAAEVADFEPRLALSGGADGLACYRDLMPDITRLLAPGGGAFLEIGQGQAGDVSALAETEGMALVSEIPDLSGIVRCLALVRDI
ncbi:MAG: peptide chain release factor N(5)-glutamine methyltransferase [Rhodospirillaceae bacterium]|jgi:release factor glutamine methyltransferase|nr:peptide chain release factor N(5)-glutamine methyltransferase [Rhodospirillaceae bacterium]MBT5752385.1 peptide chain release factor N(5)-glutamine methyltransferase [Rhodospirillaceae bacterium]